MHFDSIIPNRNSIETLPYLGHPSSIPNRITQLFRSLVQPLADRGIYMRVGRKARAKQQLAREGKNELLAKGGQEIFVGQLEAMKFSPIQFQTTLNLKVKNPKTSILICPGAGELFGTHEARIARFVGLGFHVYVFNYPGMGESKGTPNPPSLIEASKKMYEQIRQEQGPDVPVLLYSSSLGSGVASYLAKEHQNEPIAVLLDRPNARFSKLVYEVASTSNGKVTAWLMSQLTKLFYDFNTAANISQYCGPLKIIAAEQDEVVGAHHAPEIAAASPLSEKENLITLMPGGHGFKIEAWPKIISSEVQEKFEQILFNLGLITGSNLSC